MLGVVGVLVAIPVAGIAQVLIQEWWAERRRARGRDGDEEGDLVVVIE